MFAPNDELWKRIHSPGGLSRGPGSSPSNPLEERLASMPIGPAGNPADQAAQDIAGGVSQIAPAMPVLDKISPIVEYLLQMLSGGPQKPQPAYKSSEMERSPYQGTQPLRGQMMGPPPSNQTY